jgi:hypothetical protein
LYNAQISAKTRPAQKVSPEQKASGARDSSKGKRVRAPVTSEHSSMSPAKSLRCPRERAAKGGGCAHGAVLHVLRAEPAAPDKKSGGMIAPPVAGVYTPFGVFPLCALDNRGRWERRKGGKRFTMATHRHPERTRVRYPERALGKRLGGLGAFGAGWVLAGLAPKPKYYA